MLLEEFAELTQRVICKDGFEGFMPTLYLPERRHIMVLEGIPKEKEQDERTISLAWAKDKATDQQEFLLAFREDETSFRVIRSFRGEISERVFPSRVV